MCPRSIHLIRADRLVAEEGKAEEEDGCLIHASHVVDFSFKRQENSSPDSRLSVPTVFSTWFRLPLTYPCPFRPAPLISESGHQKKSEMRPLQFTSRGWKFVSATRGEDGTAIDNHNENRNKTFCKNHSVHSIAITFEVSFLPFTSLSSIVDPAFISRIAKKHLLPFQTSAVIK